MTRHEVAYLSTSVSPGCIASCDCGWGGRYDTHAAALRAGQAHEDEMEKG